MKEVFRNISLSIYDTESIIIFIESLVLSMKIIRAISPTSFTLFALVFQKLRETKLSKRLWKATSRDWRAWYIWCFNIFRLKNTYLTTCYPNGYAKVMDGAKKAITIYTSFKETSSDESIMIPCCWMQSPYSWKTIIRSLILQLDHHEFEAPD